MDSSEIIARLKFLQNVRPGDKIDTGLVVRQPDNWTTPFSRYLRGETKSKTLAFLKKTIEDAFELQKRYSESDQEHLKELAKVVINDLHAALVGVANLKRTYTHDLKFVCDLTTVSEHTQMRLAGLGYPAPVLSPRFGLNATLESKNNESLKQRAKPKKK